MKAHFFKTLLCLNIFCGTLNAQTIDTNFIDGVIYIRLNVNSTLDLKPYMNSDSYLNTLYSTYDIDTITNPFPGLDSDLDRTFRVYFNQYSLIDALIIDLNSMLDIEYAEKAPLYKTSLTPNDINSSQWALAKINAPQAWDISTGSNAVKIAIVDNAVSTEHEDLSNQIWTNPNEIPNNGLDDDLNGFIDDVNGWDAGDSDNNPNPPISASSSTPFIHGTHCAGIASASTNNNKGIASIGYNTSIIPVKCSADNSPDQGASLPGAYDGVYYAIQANADIISMSWGGSSGLFVTGESIINAAHNLGIVCIAAAGNSNTDAPHYPAAYNNVISVGATDQTDTRAGFSNYGSSIDVMAPGVSIFSTVSGNGSTNLYNNLSGTSMACPMVAGLAGLILAEFPTLTPAEVEQKIKMGCDNIDLMNPNYIGQLGAGRINAYLSLSPTFSLLNLDKSEQNQIIPNPNQGSFTVQSQSIIHSIELFTSQGKLFWSQKETTPSQFISVNINLPAGVYYLKTNTAVINSVNKVVVY
jgi:subtilisin family serine protease